MSITRPVEATLGGILLAIILILCGRYAYYNWKSESLEAKNDVLTSDASADKAYVRKYRAVIIERETKDAQVDRALQRNRDWADEPLPDDVADLLRDPAESAP